jgi:hypothetical protein
VEPDGKIVRRKPELAGHRHARLARQVDPPKQLGVLGLECRQQAVEASADHGLELHVKVARGRLALAPERVLEAVPGCPPPVVVHHGVVEHAPEPGLDVGFLVQRCLALDDLDPDLLQRVLGILVRAQATCQEAKEVALARGERSAHGFVERPERFVRGVGAVFINRLVVLFSQRGSPRALTARSSHVAAFAARHSSERQPAVVARGRTG